MRAAPKLPLTPHAINALFNRVKPGWPPVSAYMSRELVDVTEDGELYMRFLARPEWANGRGDVQGGCVAAMLDAVLGAAGISNLPPSKSVATVEMKVSYMRPTPIGVLYGVGRVVHQGGSTVFVEGELLDTGGQLLAASTSTLRIIG